MNTSFKDFLAELSFEAIVELWNTYGDPDSYIWNSLEEYADTMGDIGLELARKVFFGQVESWYDHIYLDGYANFRSCSNLETSPIDLDLLAEWLEEDCNELYTTWAEAQAE